MAEKTFRFTALRKKILKYIDTHPPTKHYNGADVLDLTSYLRKTEKKIRHFGQIYTGVEALEENNLIRFNRKKGTYIITDKGKKKLKGK